MLRPASIAALLMAAGVVLHLHSLTAYALDGFAHATESLAGAAWGARRRSAFKGAIEASTFWAAIFVDRISGTVSSIPGIGS